MKSKNKVIKNEFVWAPLDKRKSKFGGPMPPRKPELRKPLLWLARKNEELYLVNNSGEVLDSVTITSGGFCTSDDEVITCSTDKAYEYKNIQLDTAIKVDEFDDYYDLDFILQVTLKVKSSQLGCINITSPAEKGGIKETVLIWDTGESGRYVTVKQVTSLDDNL